MDMAVRKMGKSWRVDFWFNGLRYRIKGPENSKVGAEAYEAFLKQKLARGESIDVAVAQKDKGLEKFASRRFYDYVGTKKLGGQNALHIGRITCHQMSANY